MAGKRLTKAQVITELANNCDLDKKSVNRPAVLGRRLKAVLDAGKAEAVLAMLEQAEAEVKSDTSSATKAA